MSGRIGSECGGDGCRRFDGTDGGTCENRVRSDSQFCECHRQRFGLMLTRFGERAIEVGGRSGFAEGNRFGMANENQFHEHLLLC